MKRIYTFLQTAAIAFIAIAVCNCVDDKGNYNYTAPEEPQVKIDSSYNVNIGERLIIDPQTKFNDKSVLKFTWSISDPNLMRSHEYNDETLDIVFALSAQLYSAMLTVHNTANNMKYFHHFNIVGRTVFSEGKLMLLEGENGVAKLTFIKPDSTIIENLYENLNEGESLPKYPKQIVTLYNSGINGGTYFGYWLICADKRDAGVMIDVNNLTKIRTLRENFFDQTDDDIDASVLAPRSDGTMAGIINERFYVGSFEGYYASEDYGYFSQSVTGAYQLSPHLAIDASGTFSWAYNVIDKSLVAFIAPARMLFHAEHLQGPPPVWDPKNIGLDLIAFLSCPANFLILGRDSDGVVQELRFIGAGQQVMSLYKGVFAHASLIREDTKWLYNVIGELYFSSGNRIYHYNPNSGNLNILDAVIEGDISMLKQSGKTFELFVGSAGKLYTIDITPGQNGRIISTVEGFSGKPVDVYERQ